MDILYSGLEEIAQRLETSKKKATLLLANDIIPNITTGGLERKNYHSSETMISHVEKIAQIKGYSPVSGTFFHCPLEKNILESRNEKAMVVTTANQKGGVGKTTTTVNLAVSLAKLGQRVLIVDMDPQAQSSQYLTGREFNEGSIKDIFEGFQTREIPTKEKVKEYTQTISTKIKSETVDLLPAEVRLGRTLENLRTVTRAETFLHQILTLVKDDYDFIIIDTPPSASLALQQGIYAADKVLLISEANKFSVTPLRATIEEIEYLNSATEKEVEIDGILVNRFRERENIQAKYMDQIIDIAIKKLELDEDGLIIVKYAAAFISDSQEREIPILAYTKKPKEALRIASPLLKYASKIILEKITTKEVNGREKK